MFIVFLTALGLFALGALFGKRRAYWRMYARQNGYGHGHGGHSAGGCGHGRHGFGHHHHRDDFNDDGFEPPFSGRGPRVPFFVSRIFDNLEATPSQRRAIHDAIRELKGEMRGLRDSVFSSRGDLAQALRDEHLDVDALGATLAGGDDAVDRVRTAVSGFVAKLHGILDEEQRGRLADLLEKRGFRGFGGFGRGPGMGWA